jgi:hypothetical protein
MLRRFAACAALIVLAACSGNQPSDVLPTVAQLPTAANNAPPTPLIPTGEGIAVDAQATTILPFTPPTATPSADSSSAAIFAPTGAVVTGTTVPFDPAALVVTVDATQSFIESSLLLQTTIPETLRVGDILQLRGMLVVKADESGQAVLTDSQGKTLDILIDDFLAATGNNQEVEVIGEVVENSSSEGGLALRVSRFEVVTISPMPTLMSGDSAPPFIPPTTTP